LNSFLLYANVTEPKAQQMNWEQMKKNVGCRVQLVPAASRLDENGRELPAFDDDWIIEEVSSSEVCISNPRTGDEGKLGKDHIHNFSTNPNRVEPGIRYGFLMLTVQVFLQGRKLWLRPNARPGEPVKPPHQVKTKPHEELLRLEQLMPELIEEMRTDLGNNPLSREFVILKRTWTYRANGHELMYYLDDHSNLENKLRILENRGLIRDITYNRTKRYLLTEALVDYLGS